MFKIHTRHELIAPPLNLAMAQKSKLKYYGWTCLVLCRVLKPKKLIKQLQKYFEAFLSSGFNLSEEIFTNW